MWFDVRPKAVGKKNPCPVDELCSESSESSSAPAATLARWYEAFETRVTASQSTHRSEWSSLQETKPGEKGSRRSGVDQTRERGIHCLPCAKCRSVGRRCFACCSRDARDAEDNVVGREHERVRIRMTRQNVAIIVTGDQGANSPPETDVDVRVTSPPCFHERDAGAGAFASRAQETPGRNIDLVQVCHTHERLGSDSEVIVLEQVSTGIYDPHGPCQPRTHRKNLS